LAERIFASTDSSTEGAKCWETNESSGRPYFARTQGEAWFESAAGFRFKRIVNQRGRLVLVFPRRNRFSSRRPTANSNSKIVRETVL